MTETKVFSMRLDAELVKRIDALIDRRHELLYGKAGPTRARIAKENRAETIRWLLEVGLREESKRVSNRLKKIGGAQ